MLAPRKKLWSTPHSAVRTAARLLDLAEEDVLYDIGCGDGRVLIDLASCTPCRNLIGVEIDPDRASEAERNVARAYAHGTIGGDQSVRIDVGNGLETDLSGITAAFLYLVPRGLRLIKPRIIEAAERMRSGDNIEGVQTGETPLPALRVVTYMAGFEGETPVATDVCRVEHQEGAAWPIYFYHF